LRILITIIGLLLLFGCSKQPENLVQQIKKQGDLVVITRNSPTTYYIGPEGPTGLEYELARRFAKHLGVKLRIIVPERFTDIFPMLNNGDAHLAAAGLTITENRKNLVQFGPAYQKISEQLVYRMGTKKPRSIDDIVDGQLEVVAGSSHIDTLKLLSTFHPDLSWKENEDLESEELLNLVWEQVIDYTIADSNELELNQRFYPELRSAFDISEPKELAWAFPFSKDKSLIEEAGKFFAKLEETGKLEQLRERYYGHADQLNFVGTRLYIRHVKTRLPEYQPLFVQAAEENEMDWRLLAAIGYQESHWEPRAVSPTGVRGIMMLTLNTAKQMGISDRLDPEKSISGGARYLKLVENKIPDRIPKPDRIWMALAAYNVGFGHLEDARKLTQKTGGDPDKWIEVKKRLPLLSQKKWYKQTQFGYARGREPVQYVENIRIYYDLLVWHNEREKSFRDTPVVDTPEIDSNVL
jgi:membrane-bound lytic murein transglycosylase F